MTDITPLADPHRYITDNDDKGDSFFSPAEPAEVPVANNFGFTIQRLAYTSECPKVTLTGNADLQHYQESLKTLPALVRPDGGTNVWIIDIPPGGKSPVHRTVSLDFVIQVLGQVKLTLSNGDSRLIKPGDITIQRSTLHEWSNPSTTEWSRFIAVMTETEPFVTKEAGPLGTEFRQ